MANKWNIPELDIRLERTAEDEPRYRWSVILLMQDASGTRKLGYRRSGHLSSSLATLAYDGPTAVHDEDRDVWTPMNSTDRPDVQRQIDTLVLRAAKQMIQNAQDHFEHTIPAS